MHMRIAVPGHIIQGRSVPYISKVDGIISWLANQILQLFRQEELCASKGVMEERALR